MNQPAIDEEEAKPRFLLSAGPARADAVAAVLAALAPAALIVRDGSGRVWTEATREHGVALLVEDDLDRSFEADGIQLTDSGRVAEVRAALDRKRQDHPILGVEVGRSRHDAMVAGEEGANYVAFGERDCSADEAIFELIEWWRSTTVLPCLAHATKPETVTKLARIGTDFICVSSAIWNHPDGPDVAAIELRAAIEKT